ncbi:hypothetical protein [Aeromonas enteropelogenes]|uniref:hypothetical protein n=1 Tax=Aeromonas enteropelogenes TaxID=29489 RepID=UPI003B9DFA71
MRQWRGRYLVRTGTEMSGDKAEVPGSQIQHQAMAIRDLAQTPICSGMVMDPAPVTNFIRDLTGAEMEGITADFVSAEMVIDVPQKVVD